MRGYFRREFLSIIPDQPAWISETDYPAMLKKKKNNPPQVAGGNFSRLAEQLQQQPPLSAYRNPLRMFTDMDDAVHCKTEANLEKTEVQEENTSGEHCVTERA